MRPAPAPSVEPWVRRSLLLSLRSLPPRRRGHERQPREGRGAARSQDGGGEGATKPRAGERGRRVRAEGSCSWL